MAHQGRVQHAHSEGGAVDAPRTLEIGAAALKLRRSVEQQRECEHSVVAVHRKLRLASSHSRSVLDYKHVERQDARGGAEAEAGARFRLDSGEQPLAPERLESWQASDRDVGGRVGHMPIRTPPALACRVLLRFCDGVRARGGAKQREYTHALHRMAVRRRLARHGARRMLREHRLHPGTRR